MAQQIRIEESRKFNEGPYSPTNHPTSIFFETNKIRGKQVQGQSEVFEGFSPWPAQKFKPE